MSPRRRHQVVLRPKVRGEMFRQRSAAAAVLLLGAVAAAVVSHLGAQWPLGPGPSAWLARVSRPLEFAGAPEPVLAAARRAAEAQGPEASISRVAEAVLGALPCVRSVEPRRRWLRKGVVLRVVPRVPAARVTRSGRPVGLLGMDGALYEACEGLKPGELPSVELAGAGDSARSGAVELARALGTHAGPPSGLQSLRWVSEQEGWRARFSDGTIVLWGDLRWTAEKLIRLAQVAADAAGDLGGGATVDLRYFEDGKVLLRPSAAR